MSHSIEAASPSPSLAPPALPTPSHLLLRGRAGFAATGLREQLPMVLAACGCGGLVRRDASFRSTFTAELPLETALAVYARLVQEGVVFDPTSHMAWAQLCTLQAFAATLTLPPGRTVHWELELTYPDLRAGRQTRLAAGRA